MLYLVIYLVCDLAGRSELPDVCDPVVSTAQSNSRHFSSFTDRAEHQSINFPENVNFLWRFNDRKSGRPDNTAYVGSHDKHVSRKSVSLPEIVIFL